ncbi:MAG: GNAT family N-acetyltransferase [Stackebrandtia sp.]
MLGVAEPLVTGSHAADRPPGRYARLDDVKPSIRACRPGDVAVLDRHNPSPSVASFHAQRYARQTAGTATYLIAWYGRTPAGHAEINFATHPAAEVARAHPHCPEIRGLEVFPAHRRSHGIGTALISRAETAARRHGFDHIGLGVAVANNAAARLYHRLSYRGDLAYHDLYTCLDSLGTRHHFADECVFLTKALPRFTSPRAWLARLTRTAAHTTTPPGAPRRHM